jgi:hypothetical protein
MLILPNHGNGRRDFFGVVGRYFDQRRVPFLIPDLARDIEFGVYITIAHARTHDRPEVREWYRDVCRWFVEFDGLMTNWRANRCDITYRPLLRHAGIREPWEVRLGYTEEGHRGRAVGRKTLHRKLIRFFDAYPDILRDCMVNPDTLSMAVDFGMDRVSDTMVAVGKRRAIAFTQWCAQYFQFDPRCLRDVVIENIWQPENGRFGAEEHCVPVDDDGQPILLVPSYIVRSAPPFSTDAYFRNVYGPDYSGPTGKGALLADAAEHPGRLSEFATDWLKDPNHYKIRRDLRPLQEPKPRRRSK